MPIKKSRLETKWYFRVGKVLLLSVPVVVAGFYLYLNKDGVMTEAFWQKQGIYLGMATAAYYVVLAILWQVILYLVFGGLEDDMRPKDKAAPATTPTNKIANEVAPLIALLIIIIIAGLFQSGTLRMSDFGLGGQTFGSACVSGGKSGLYGTNGHCYSCTGGGVASTSPSGNCSNAQNGIYCCSSGSGISGGDGGGTQCIPTGCANLWRCTGNYSIGNQSTYVNSCFPVNMSTVFPNWTGMCRQCPN